MFLKIYQKYSKTILKLSSKDMIILPNPKNYLICQPNFKKNLNIVYHKTKKITT